jgi:2-(1,2-epoxy-1,2-dihydrophenyl)acetyl-CoA isomerase
LVGTARAKGMTMLGDALSAKDAERWGLIWASVEDEALPEQAATVARRLAVGPTQSYRRIKAVFNHQPGRTLPEQLAVEAVLQTELGDTQDFAEGVLAFRSKRAPQFTGT